MNKTEISYLTFTWNPTHGCSPISEGCQKCWAQKMSKRLAGNNIRGYDKTNPFKPTFCEWALNEPLERKKPSVIGTSFMGDLFHEDITDDQIWMVFIVMHEAHWHNFVLCTKRPQRMLNIIMKNKEIIPVRSFNNIWFGCTVENKQSTSRILDMAALKQLGFNTWLSIEPLLEDISDSFYLVPEAVDCFDCFVIGGESGPGARFCDEMWISNILDVIPEEKFYFKQGGTNKMNVNTGVDISRMSQIKNLPWQKK